MRFRTRKYALAFGLALGCLTAPVQAQLPPPPPPPATLWSFLGIPQGFRYIRDNSFNTRGNRPGMERRPPLKAIADPKNLASADPAIKKAAEVKMAEDLKPQKIKAVKYLASIGCGCYNRDGAITDALLKSMDDCTEEVRLQTVWAISEAAAGEACANCKMRSCCSEEISNKLYEIAYERDDTGCFLEPSERVRLAAAEALRTCCPGGDEDFIIEMAPVPTPIPGGEQPGVVPESGGERPGVAPPVVPPVPPVVPPVPPPVATPAPPAPAGRPRANSPSSRRTAEADEKSPRAEVAPAVAINGPVDLDPPSATPHWLPGKAQQSIYFVPPARGPLPIAEPQIPNSVAVRVDVATNVSPIMRHASLTRLPPVDTPTSGALPAPPLPPMMPQAIPVSTHRSQNLPPRHEESVLQRPAGSPQPVMQPIGQLPPGPIPVSQRELPGAQFGTGMVRAVRFKEGVAMLQFETDAAVPPGSIVRAYHDYALTGKTPVCDLEVVRTEAGFTAAMPRAGSEITALSVGDRAIVLR